MSRLFCIGTMACFCIAFATKAECSVLTFDDVAVLTGDQEVMLGVYGGLTWDNMAVLNGGTVGGGATGYNGGRASGEYVAYNRFGTQAAVELGTFDFVSAYLASAFRNGMQMRAQGYLNNNLLYEETIQLLDASATPGAGTQKYTFNFNGIDRLVLFGLNTGSNAGLGGSGRQFVLDNFEFRRQSPVIPEPGSLLMWCGLGIAGSVLTNRRRRR